MADWDQHRRHRLRARAIGAARSQARLEQRWRERAERQRAAKLAALARTSTSSDPNNPGRPDGTPQYKGKTA